jgi:hypothetical protein
MITPSSTARERVSDVWELWECGLTLVVDVDALWHLDRSVLDNIRWSRLEEEEGLCGRGVVELLDVSCIVAVGCGTARQFERWESEAGRREGGGGELLTVR